MTKLSQILGFLFLAAGLVLAVLCLVMSGSMQVYGLTPEVAAILLVGGGICIGIGGLPDALHMDHAADAGASGVDDLRRMPTAPAVAEKPKLADVKAKPDLKAVGVGAAAAVVTEAVRGGTADARPSVAETIEALEQAKNDIASALSIEKPAPVPEPKPKPSIAAILEKPLAEKPKSEPPVVLQMPAPPPPPPPAAVEADEADEADDPDLYVVEEKVIRGRPARVLSDGTVEAETDEGWMRFENLEHLDEYLDAMSPGA